MKLPGVSSVSVSSRVPGEWKNLPQVRVTTPENNAGLLCYFIGADENFFDTYEMKLVSGINFREDFPGDSSSIIINEIAAEKLGISQPGEEVVIPSVNMAVNEQLLEEPFRARVIGIVRNFNFQSLHQEIAPLVIGYQSNPIHSIDYFTIRISSNNMAESLEQMQAAMHTVDPNHLLEYNFLDERLSDFYTQDLQSSRLFAVAAGVAIGLACLGLFSLVSFNTAQRTREIGVRKVLGATTSQITVMLCSEYVKLVAIGFAIAIPLSFWALNQWLCSFAYRISVAWLILLTACTISFAVTIVTVGLKSMRAAVANPADSLRTE
jgi:putative ABC transport system permease protein